MAAQHPFLFLAMVAAAGVGLPAFAMRWFAHWFRRWHPEPIDPVIYVFDSAIWIIGLIASVVIYPWMLHTAALYGGVWLAARVLLWLLIGWRLRPAK